MSPPFPLRSAFPFLLAGAASLALGGCDSRRGYPSLAPRPIERSASDGAAPAPTIAAVATPDPARDARAAALAEQAVEADAAFVRSANDGCRTIVAGLRASEGSEAWVGAQQALSSLDATRGAVRAAAAGLDRLLIDSSGGESAPVDTSRIAAAMAQVSAIEAAEQTRADALQAGTCAG